MQSEFQKKWYELSKKKKSLIIAGCDPSIGQKGLKNFCLKYVKAVAPYVAGIKCNPAYFQSVARLQTLKLVADFCKKNNLLSIIDYKISDIGSTNEAWISSAKSLGFDAVTIAPYAGNISETIKLCEKYKIASITMGLMSNPEFALEADFAKGNKKLFEYRTEISLKEKVDGLVLGATYKKDDKNLKSFLKLTKNKNVLFLVPGIGTQGGTAEEFLKTGVDPLKCMLNVGRALMHPKTTWAAEARKLKLTTEKYF